MKNITRDDVSIAVYEGIFRIDPTLQNSKIQGTNRFKDDLNLDSLDLLDLCYGVCDSLEADFDPQKGEAAMAEANTIDDLITVIFNQISKHGL